MKAIESIYRFASELGYDVAWSEEEKNTFVEIISEKTFDGKIQYQQDGDRLIITAPKLSLEDTPEATIAVINSNALAMNINNHHAVFYGLVDDTIYARTSFLISDKIDDVITQFIRARLHMLNAVSTSDLLPVVD